MSSAGALSRLRSVWVGFRNVYSRNLKFRIGFTVFMAIVVLGLVSLFAPPYFESWYILPKDRPPSLESVDMLLGTTTHGRSVFWMLSRGILNSLTISMITALVASHLGLFIGMVAGMKGGLVDRALMFLTDTFVVIPQLPLLIVLAMLLKGMLTMPLLGLLISITSWPWPARQVRAIVLSLRERDFITVAQLSGMGTGRIILTEIMPHLLGWHLINATNTVLYAIGSEAGLAVLGLSILDKDTLGTIIYWALSYSAIYRGIWWWVVSPVIALIVLFASLYLISVGYTEYLNPRLRYQR